MLVDLTSFKSKTLRVGRIFYVTFMGNKKPLKKFKPWDPNVIVGIKECHEPVPDGEDAEDVVQDRGHVQHQVGRDQPEGDNDRQLRRVLRVAGGRQASH